MVAGLSVRKFAGGILLVAVVTGIGFMWMKADVAGAGCGEVAVSIGRNSDGGGARVVDVVAAGSSMGRKSDGAGARVVDVVAAGSSMGRKSVGGGAPTAVVVSSG